MNINSASIQQPDGPIPEFSFPLSSTQARCWFLDQLRPGDASLNVTVRWELLGEIPDDKIEASFRSVIQRHEVLRSRLVARDGTPVQEVLPSIDFGLSTTDLRAIPAEKQSECLDIIDYKMAAEPFDLARPPLIRVKLVRLSNERAMLLIVAHQSVFDGYSIGVLGHEFGTILDALEKGTEPALPELPLQYGDYALWQAEYLASEAVKDDTNFWKSHLANLRYFEVPPDFTRPSVRGTSGANVHVNLPLSFGERLDKAARRFEMSPFSFGVGVLSVALHQFTGAKEVVFGTQIAGRDEVELEGLIGVFINNLVLRLPTKPGSRVSDQLAIAKQVVKDALLHQKMPFNKLVEALRPTRDLSRNPLVSINFNLQRNTFLKNRRYDTFELISRPSHAAGVIYDFNFLLIGRPDGWRLTVEYNTDLFTRETAQRLINTVVASFEKSFEVPESVLEGMQSISQAAMVPAVNSDPGSAEFEKARPEKIPAKVAALGSHARLGALGGGLVAGASPSGDVFENDILRRLAGMWSELLGLPAEQCDDDFFKLGGHSLLAMRMLARAEVEFGVKPGVGVFLAEPTLQAFAERVHTAMDQVRSKLHGEPTERIGTTWDLIELRGARRNDPVIVTINHPIFYYMLAGSFGSAAAISNLRIPDTASLSGQYGMTFDDICLEAAKKIMSVYKDRRIVLLGLCVNGRVALNIGQQLEAMGVNVGGVVMLDSWAPATFKHQSWGGSLLRKWAVRQRRWQHYLSLCLKGRISMIELIGKNRAGAAFLRRIGFAEPNVEEANLLGNVTDHLLALTRDYSFSGYDGEVILFKTDASPLDAVETMFGWGSVLREDTPVYTVSGWHEDALSNSGIQKVARIIERRMLILPSDSQINASQSAEISQSGGERSSAA